MRNRLLNFCVAGFFISLSPIAYSSSTAIPSIPRSPAPSTPSANTPPVMPSTTPQALSPQASSTSQATAQAPIRNFGALQLNGLEATDLEQGGMLQLSNARVTQLFLVNGIVNVDHTNLNNVKINGSGTFKNSTIFGTFDLNGHMDAQMCTFAKPVNITGYINAEKCTFNQLISLQGVNANFTSSTVQDIQINAGSADLIPHIILKGTKILGTITFTGGNGVVTADSTSSVTASAVKGGTIQQQ